MATIPISFAGGGGSDSSDVTASSAQVLKGYTAITTDSDDEPKEGTIPSKAAQTYYVLTTDQVIALNQYLAGNQTIKAVSQSNLSAGNVKKGVTISVSNGNSDLWSVAGTYSTPSNDQLPIIAEAIRAGYAGFVNGGEEIRGTIPEQAAKTVYATTSSQTAIAAGTYASGNISVAALSQSGLSAANLLRNKTISISNGNTNVWSVTGSTAGGLRLVSGTVTTGSWYNGGEDNITKVPVGYSDISPGITPIIVVSYSEGGLYGASVMLQDNELFYNYYDQVNRHEHAVVSLPRTSSQTRILGVFPQGTNTPTTSYYIYGY